MNEPIYGTARSLAVRAVPISSPAQTIESVLLMVQNSANEFETIDYVYVIESNKLVGVLSLHELFAAKKSRKISEIMTEPVAYVHENTDQEHIVNLALAQSIKAVPVLDENGLFFGVVQADTILQVLREEHTEDLMRYAGVNYTAADKLANFTLAQHVISRLPWLLLGLLGGLAAALVVEQFHKILESEILLAAFIPAIVYIADAVGSQTQMVYIRSLVQNERKSIFVTIGKELIIAIIVGLALASLTASAVYLWFGSLNLSLTLGFAVMATVVFSVVVAIVLPWIFQKVGQDPALASGPLATVVCDISSLCIYLFIANALFL